MNVTMKNSLIIAAAIAGIGFVIAIIGGLVMGGMQGVTIGADGVKTTSDDVGIAVNQTYEKITSIDADLDNRDVILKEGTEYSVKSKGVSEDFYAENESGILKISEENSVSNFNINLFNFSKEGGEHSDLIITYPKGELDSVKVHTDSGDVSVTNLNSGKIELSSSLGDIDLHGVKTSRGEFKLDSGSLSITQSNMDTLKYTLSLGDVDAENLTAKKIEGTNSSGETEIEGTIAGPVSISSSLGDVDLVLRGNENAYSFDIQTELGEIEVNDQEYGDSYIRESVGKPQIKLDLDSGSASVDFVR